MFVEQNVNPYNANIDDCVIRAISKALDKPYWDVFDDLCSINDNCFPEHNVNSFAVFHKYLNDLGYECKEMIEKYTVKQFAEEFYEGTYLLLVNGHMTCVIDGNVYDTWNCNRYKVQLLWVVEL